MDNKSIRESLLELSSKEKKERKMALSDYLYYLGECEDKETARTDHELLGQSWINLDDLDYEPSQVIDNKVKPLISKQARFMMGQPPNLSFKPLDKNNRESCEKLRQYIDAIFNANRFWSISLKAFRLATTTKRVLLRLEANPNQPVRIFYHSINEFNYKLDPNDFNKLIEVTFVKQDSNTADKEQQNQLWYRYTYYYKEKMCYLKKETFKGDKLNTPLNIDDNNTGLNKIPCWLIANEQCIENVYGVSDVKDLRPLQNQINRRISDISDALRFDMFGQTVIVDANDDSVNKAQIAPNSLLPLVSVSGKNASVKKVESTFQNAEAADKFLKRLEDSMYDKLCFPRSEQLKNIPSAKTLKFVYFDLMSRCSEKWHDWEPPIRALIRLIIEACGKFNCYEDWNHEWDTMLFNIVLKKNYPIPEDEQDSKRLALEEVRANVRSPRSYIKEYTDDENYESCFKEVLEDIEAITAAEQDQYSKGVEDELNDNSGGGES